MPPGFSYHGKKVVCVWVCTAWVSTGSTCLAIYLMIYLFIYMYFLGFFFFSFLPFAGWMVYLPPSASSWIVWRKFFQSVHRQILPHGAAWSARFTWHRLTGTLASSPTRTTLSPSTLPTPLTWSNVMKTISMYLVYLSTCDEEFYQHFDRGVGTDGRVLMGKTFSKPLKKK